MSADFQSFIRPMMAKRADEPFDREDWMFELKFDGYRAVSELNGPHVRLYSRNELNFAGHYPTVVHALKALNLHAVFDGEIVALNSEGHQGFQYLQQSLMDSSIRHQYFIFDMLESNGENIRERPLIERKKMLCDVLKENEVLRYSEHIKKEGKELFKLAVKAGMEGIMAKKMESFYYDGIRTGDWLKIKHHHQQEAIIIGYNAPKASRKYFGSVLLAEYHDHELIYIGNMGTGFDDATLKSLYEAMQPLRIDHPPVKKFIRSRYTTWVKPVLVCAVKYTEKTQDGYLRFPVFLGMRPDKSPDEVVNDQS
ncbi:MAG: non-homologous end-joining DNA ligase [Candidatus Omnitrophota bacterium]